MRGGGGGWGESCCRQHVLVHAISGIFIVVYALAHIVLDDFTACSALPHAQPCCRREPDAGFAEASALQGAPVRYNSCVVVVVVMMVVVLVVSCFEDECHEWIVESISPSSHVLLLPPPRLCAESATSTSVRE